MTIIFLFYLIDHFISDALYSSINRSCHNVADETEWFRSSNPTLEANFLTEYDKEPQFFASFSEMCRIIPMEAI